MWSALLSILTTGAGGGIVGGLFALIRTRHESKERIALRELDLRYEQMQAEREREQRQHELKTAEIGLKKTITEGEIAADVAHMNALQAGVVTEFKDLHKDSEGGWLRGSVRPVIAYWLTVMFTVFLYWAFSKFAGQLSPADGKEILLGLLLTLEFGVNSVWSFYYVARRNDKARV